jgi:hypothetical protein
MTREDWLTQLVDEVRPLFPAHTGQSLPARIRVACGFPSSARRSGAIGECWADASSADGTVEILISPVVDDVTTVAATLIHELCHALPGSMNHSKTFAAHAWNMGLVAGAKGWKSTGPGPEFDARYSAILADLGPYPHAHLIMSAKPKQSTRMLKAVCPGCGYTIRLTRTWAEKGLPLCSQDGEQFQLESNDEE